MENQTSKQYFLMLNIIFAAIVVGQLLFFGVIVVVMQGMAMPEITEGGLGQSNLIAVSFGSLLLAIFAAQKIFQSRILEIRRAKSLLIKANGYRVALIIKYMIMEVPVIASLVFYFLEPNIILVAVVALSIGYSLVHRPNLGRMVNDLELSREEQELLANPDAIIK